MRQEVSRRLTVLAKDGQQSWRKMDNSPGERWTTVLAKDGRQSWRKLDDSPGGIVYSNNKYAAAANAQAPPPFCVTAIGLPEAYRP